MKPLLALLLFVLVPLLPSRAKETPYIDSTSIDATKLLPNPPASGSAQERTELDHLLALQKDRTPEQVARIQVEEHLQPWVFADVLGPWFQAAKLPLTAALLAEVDHETGPISSAAKDFWARPRPPVRDPRIVPPIKLPANPAYPSGHSTAAVTYAVVLGALAPESKEKLMARAYLVGEDREIAGVHYPSDVEAGRTLGKAIGEKFLASSAFQADLKAARAECDAARTKP